jgi:threonine aldolase
VIDLRSDTVTRPTDAMREAMARADVGDDYYSEDPSVNRLQETVAELLGKEAALFVPTGTMSNQVALRTHTEPGDLALMDAGSHMVRSEGGAAAALGGVTVRPLHGRFGLFGPAEVEAEIEPDHRFDPLTTHPRPRLLCVENTHNSGGGVPWPLERLRAVSDMARRHGMATHMDGARLWHAAAATGVDLRDLAEPFDTVSVCFSKGLGAPVGSALTGPASLMPRARRFRQQYGGGMRQAGVLAAAALHALEHHRARLGDDIANARAVAEGLAATEGIHVDLETVRSNIVRFEVTAMTAADFVDRCHEAGVHMLPGGTHGVRAVTHIDVDRKDVERAVVVMREVVARYGSG